MAGGKEPQGFMVDMEPKDLQEKLTLLEIQVLQALQRLESIEDSFISSGEPSIQAQSSSSLAFTGVYWFKGKRYELSGTAKAYWYHNEATSSGAWSDGPMPDPFPDMMYWRETATCGYMPHILC